jgi:hypothetical protein
LDCSKDQHILQKVYGPHKSDGERSYLLHVFNHIQQLKNTSDIFTGCKHFFKLSGRYWLDEHFEFEKYNIDKNVICTVDPSKWQNACVSCLFKLAFSTISTFVSALTQFAHNFQSGMCTEEFLYHYVHHLKHEAKHEPILGCGGLIAINGIEGHC